jgi:DNA-binding GntR family transcriptional regulator
MAEGALSRRVYNEILGRLLRGEVKPGQFFNRRQIAAELGVSVAPVLEAMLELQTEGLIESLPRQGTRVRQLTVEDVRGQLIVREALECQAARLYCGPPVEKDLPRLLPMAREIDAAELRSIEHIREEVRFHHELVSLAAVPALNEAFERVMKLGLLFAVQALHPSHKYAPKSSHVKLVNALVSSDADAAEAVVRAHVQSGKEALFERWSGAEARRAHSRPAWLGE